MPHSSEPHRDFRRSVLLGTWTYRSLLNDPDLSLPFNDLKFGAGNIRVDPAPMDELTGLLYGDGWQLELSGAISYGNPFTVDFQGKGVIGGSEWIYAYRGYYVPRWPNGVHQRPAMVGSIVRVIPHPGDGGVHPAGVVNSWYAVKQDPSHNH